MPAVGDYSPSGASPRLLSNAIRTRNAESGSRTRGRGRSDSHGVRASIEEALGLLRSHGSSNNSLDEDRDNDSRGLEKLLPKRIRSRRRRKKEQRASEEIIREEAARGRSVAERGTLEDDPNYLVKTHSSSAADVDDSSLLTYESDEGSTSNTPPPLVPHPSHVGYLTTSSPLIKSSALSQDFLSSGRASASPSASPSAFPPTLTTASLQAPSEVSSKTPTSPVGKLKEAFISRRATSPNPSLERKAQASPAARQEKDTSDTIKRRGSVAARIGAIFPERHTPQAAEVQPSPERPRSSRAPYMIETNGRPSTPPTGENAAPVIVNTPPTPTEAGSPRFSASPGSITSNPNVVTSASGNMISHRRMRSGSGASGSIGPSKLSNIISAPLTPTLEDGSTSHANAPQQSGFFSTVFSAAQNAASTLSNSISNTTLPGQTRIRSNTQDGAMNPPIDDVEVETPDDSRIRSNSETQEPAVKTLGMGDLSLSQLGITETSSGANTPTTAKFSETPETRGRSATVGAQDDIGRSVTAAPAMMTDKGDSILSPVGDDGPATRSWSVYEPSVTGDQTPPNGSIFDGKQGIIRSSSARSALGASRRRKRGSSAATGTTIGAGIAANSLPNAVSTGTTPKLTGFAVASKKRNRDFHQLFRSVPDDDYLIEDYSCALQREILAHGRLYVSEGHLCFNSNIFGWVTTLVMSFDEIVSVEKRSTALLFKNGLMISTLHSKNVFASFTSRDSTYDLIVGIWKLGHPSLRSSLNGVRIDETGGGDKTEKDDGQLSQSAGSASDDETEDEVYDEDEEDEDADSFIQGDGTFEGSDIAEKPATRKPPATAAPNGTTAEKKEGVPAAIYGDFPGPATHASTDCSDQDTHYDKVIADEVIQAPLGQIYNLMFGPASVAWMSRWLTVEQKCLDLQMEDKKGLSNENKARTYSYIKPLNAPIGPRQTKCIITENLDSLDLDKAVSVTMSTSTPDVPSGNVFTTKTKYCLTWAENNGTRLQMNCTIEWTGKSWLKGPIEKGANDGQLAYARDLLASLRSAVSTRPRAGIGAAAAKAKRKARKGAALMALPKAPGAAAAAKAEDWGVLEPLHGILGPLVDMVRPLGSANMVYGLLVGLLVAAWFGFGYRGQERELGSVWSSPERIVAYEEIWRREESELWEWLETRVGMDRVQDGSGGWAGNEDVKRGIEDRLGEEGASDKEVEVAIKVTEEKLRALKGAMERKRRSGERRAGREKGGDGNETW